MFKILISSVVNIADEKVNAYKSPIGIAMNLFLADNPNLMQLKTILGFSTNDIRGEIVDGANERRMSASEYANYFISSMDISQLQKML